MEVYAEWRTVQGAADVRHRATTKQSLRPCKSSSTFLTCPSHKHTLQGWPALPHVTLLSAGVPPVSTLTVVLYALNVCCTHLSCPGWFLHVNLHKGLLVVVSLAINRSQRIYRRKGLAHSSAQDVAAQSMNLKRSLTQAQAGCPSSSQLLVLLMRPSTAQSRLSPELRYAHVSCLHANDTDA